MALAGLLVKCLWKSISWLHVQLRSRGYVPPDSGMAGFPANHMVGHLGIWATWCQRMKKAGMVTAIGHGEGEKSTWSRNTVS